jgi:hypothetical protein
MPTVGDIDIAQLVVDPFDATTAATLTALAPDGTPTHPATSTADAGHTWTSTPITLNQAGWWVYVWTVTGTGAGAEAQRLFVAPNPTSGGPTWTPDRQRVASYIPGRALVGAADGYGNALGAFDSTTHPTGEQVDRLIADAAAWVELKTGAVDASLDEAATATAAVYAAYQIELSYPDNSRDVGVADQLWRQAVAMRDDLARANEAATGDDPEDPSAHLAPVYSFPDVDAVAPWGDSDWIY